jgi:hypothetical protein
MKSLFFILCLCCLAQNAFAQATPFAPVGAKWTYQQFERLGPLISKTIKTATCEKDTLVGGKLCSKIRFEFNICYAQGNPMFVYQDNGKVYFYNDNQFLLLHDYKGSSWTITYKSMANNKLETLFLSVLGNKSIVTPNGKKVNQQTVSIDYLNLEGKIAHYTTSTLFENIGFPFHLFPKQTQQPCDPFVFIDTIRCYEDSKVGLIKFVAGDCDKISSTKQLSDNQEITSFPNPVNRQLSLDLGNYDFSEGVVRFFTLQGQEVGVFPFVAGSSTQHFDVESLREGAYFWQVDLDKKIRKTGKFIVVKD